VALTARGEQTLRSAQALVGDGLAAALADLPAPEAARLARLLGRLERMLGGTAPPRRPPRPPPPPRP
jgi:hypothetical protein